ncbi:hypothetical protein NR402_18380, partial [Acidithiobacillus ferrooxidans]|uniref:hypothetical protein n=1 Tax=Acidithiobacillus ferrooxidans TaxID=920 RepID=UPI00214B38B8
MKILLFRVFIQEYKHITRVWQCGNPEWLNMSDEILPMLWGGSGVSLDILLALSLRLPILRSGRTRIPFCQQ